MNNDELFQKNVRRWELFCPESAIELKKIESNPYKFSETLKGEPNLYREEEFLHSQEGALEEAQQWFSKLDLQDVRVLYVYGVGLGYIYDAAKEWLKDSRHYLIFLENDLDVIHSFFQTERAYALLHDPQSRLYHFIPDRPLESVWMELSQIFGTRSFRIHALDSYAKRPGNMLGQINTSLSFWNNLQKTVTAEYSTYGQHYFTNFYRNSHYLPHSYVASDLWGKFAGVPAIICGAGPSLDKNLALLETLGDRALIFAGATSLNAVNSNGFVPHFGVGIDPNPGQVTRLVMNTAYEAPFLYRHRFNPEARALIQGPPLFVTGGGGYHISEWLEKELGIPSKDVNEGCNVVNFSLALAHAFGCNPIIFVGLDLAYTEGHSYQSGVESHPVHSRQRDFRTKTVEEDLVTKNDIFGNPVSTLWKWIAESLWFAQFAILNDTTLFINATEGGIGIPGVPNKPLDEVVHHLLPRHFDLRLRVHGETQNAQMPKDVTGKHIRDKFEEMELSLARAQDYCEKIRLESLKLADEVEKGSSKPGSLMTEEAQAAEEKLKEEIAYKYIIEDFNNYYQPATTLDYQKIAYDHFISASTSAAKKARLQAERYKFLRTTAMISRALISIYGMHKSRLEDFERSAANPSQDISADEQYSFDGTTLTLIDPELDLNIHDTLPSGTILRPENLHYPSGALKMEQHYLGLKLHGPVTFYDESGGILGQSWYVHGVQQGKSRLYYLGGAKYSVQRYRDGMLEGLQEYYYMDGKPKTMMRYRQDKLDGEVLLYHLSGSPKRELHFSEGKRHGSERMWNLAGRLLIEAEYKEGTPVGIVRTWHENGIPSQVIVYDENGVLLKTQRWDENGMVVTEPGPDYFDWVTVKTQSLTQALGNFYRELRLIAPLLPKNADGLTPVVGDVTNLQEQMTILENLGQSLLQESGLDGTNEAEPIWKSPQAYKEMQKQLEETTNRLKEEMVKIGDLISQAKARIEMNQQEMKKKAAEEKKNEETDKKE